MSKEKKKRGPEAQTLEITSPTWEEALGKAIQKQRPAEGWPKPEPPARKKPAKGRKKAR